MPNFLSGLGGMANGLSQLAPDNTRNNSQLSSPMGPSQDILSQLLPLLMQHMQRNNAMGAPNQLQNSIFRNQGNAPQIQAPVQNQPPNQNSMVGNSMNDQSQPMRNFGPINTSGFRF